MTRVSRIPVGDSTSSLVPTFVVLLCVLPLLVTPVLPTVDFYAHMVRYNVLAHPEAYAPNYLPHWALLPNLGMDLLGAALLSVLPPLLGAKVLVALVILAPVLGTMKLSHALHGRLSPMPAALAGLLAYNLILFWGFANFLLGLGIALWSVGGWIALRDRPIRQLLYMVPAGVLILLIHGLVFGLWGLLLGAVELGLAREAGALRLSNLMTRAARLLLLAVIPIFLFLQMSTAEAEGGTTGALQNLTAIAKSSGSSGLFNRLWEEMLKRLDSILRVVETSSPLPDRLFGLLMWVTIGSAFFTGVLRSDQRLWAALSLTFLLIWLMPPNLFGVGHLDERMPLLFLAVLIASVSVQHANRMATPSLVRALLVLMFPLHILLAVWGQAQVGGSYRAFLSEIRQIDTGELAVALFAGGTTERDTGRYCKPLLFLLQLQNGTAVQTFANPTQQPLRLTGPLAAAIEHLPPPSETPAATIPAYLAAGFDTVVACSDQALPQNIPGVTIPASGAGWALYQNQYPPDSQ